VPPLEEVNSRHQYRRSGKNFRMERLALGNARGTGRLPFDNVSEFFLKEGYAAVVPGNTTSTMDLNICANCVDARVF